MDAIYHLTTPDRWDEAQAAGTYQAASLATEGFIHASTIEQLEGSANRFYADLMGVILLKIVPAKLAARLVWEASSHSATPFPHIYGSLNLDAVAEATYWEKSSDGRYHLPADED